MANHETQPNQERQGGFLNAWKKFNTATMFVWLAAWAITENATFGLAAGFDFAQNKLIEGWQRRKQAAKPLGRTALHAV